MTLAVETHEFAVYNSAVRELAPDPLAQLRKRRERIAIPGDQPNGVAIDISESAKPVVFQLEEPIRVGKGSRPADKGERLNMREKVHGFHCAQALRFLANPGLALRQGIKIWGGSFFPIPRTGELLGGPRYGIRPYSTQCRIQEKP